MRRLPTLFLVLVTTALGQAPSGFRSAVDDDTGLRYFAPTDYAEIPLAPTEMALRVRFQRKTIPDELARVRGAQKPEIVIYCFERGGGTTPAPETPKTPDTEGGSVPPPPEEDDGAPKSVREAMERASSVEDFSGFRKSRLGGWKLDAVDGKPGHFAMTPGQGGQGAAPGRGSNGYLVTREEGGFFFGVYGVAHPDYEARLRATIGTIAQGMRLPTAVERKEREDSVLAALSRLYPEGKFKGTERRKDVRRGLARGWKVVDTENYIIVHHSDDEKLINKIARDIEAMRAFYTKLFPPVKPVEAVSIVRVCRSRGEFLAYGGPPTAGGYWHAGNEELVFYDYYKTTMENQAAGVETPKTTDKDSLLVLYHEAFHQYIHYAVGEIAPHDWFNEGHGDYFSGAVIPQYGTKVERIGPSRWRIHLAKDHAAGVGKPVPLENLVRAQRAEYYNPARARDYYAAGWSFVYFLRESERVAKHPRWSRLLDDYFTELKRAYLEAIAGKGERPSLAERQAAQVVAREKALDAFLKDTNLAELEAEWKAFIERTKSPWPDPRKKK